MTEGSLQCPSPWNHEIGGSASGRSSRCATRPPGRFGELGIRDDRVETFKEKPVDDAGWINGGFFVLSPKVIRYIDGDQSAWEQEPMERLSRDGQSSAYVHDGFWQPMDTLRDKNRLESLWQDGRAPWKVW